MTNNDFFVTLGGIALAFIAILLYVFGFMHAGNVVLGTSLLAHIFIVVRYVKRHGEKPDTLRSA